MNKPNDDFRPLLSLTTRHVTVMHNGKKKKKMWRTCMIRLHLKSKILHWKWAGNIFSPQPEFSYGCSSEGGRNKMLKTKKLSKDAFFIDVTIIKCGLATCQVICTDFSSLLEKAD